MSIHSLVFWFKWRLKYKENFVLSNYVGDSVPASSFQTAISNSFESETSTVVRSCLLRITDPEDNMIKSKVFTDFRFNSFIRVTGLKDDKIVESERLFTIRTNMRMNPGKFPMSERKRFVGPEGSVKPVFNLSKFPSLTEADILDSETLCRLDGRFPEQLRSLVIRPNIITEAKGSCYLELGNTKLTCAVYGPRSSGKQGKTYSNRGTVYCEVDLLPFAQAKRRGFQRETDEVELATLLQDTLTPALRVETFPNSTVDVYINVLEADGSVLAAAITASSVAVMLAGIEMNDLVIGASFVSASGTLLTDPNSAEEAASPAKLTIGQLANSDSIAQFYLNGPLDNTLLRESLIMSREVVAAVHEYIKSIIVDQ